MKAPPASPIRPRQPDERGVMLIEALIAILVFSIGILGLIGLQGAAAKASVDARYRSEAALLANELIGQMWASDRTQATLQANFASAAGTKFQAWAWKGSIAASPGTQTASGAAAGTVYAKLPGAAANPPTVVIAASAGTAVPTSQVTITIFWTVPGEGVTHQYKAIAQVGG